MSKGTQTRLAQIPEQAKFLMKRFVTDLSSDVLQVDHSTMMLPVSRDRKHKKRKTDKQTAPSPNNKNLNTFECSLVLQMKIIVWSLPGITDLDHDAAQIRKSVRASGFMNQKAGNNYTHSSYLLSASHNELIRGFQKQMPKKTIETIFLDTYIDSCIKWSILSIQILAKYYYSIQKLAKVLIF